MKLIHTPYKAYNRWEDKWEWTVEVFSQELIIHTFNSKEEAEEFKNEKELENNDGISLDI